MQIDILVICKIFHYTQATKQTIKRQKQKTNTFVFSGSACQVAAILIFYILCVHLKQYNI